MSADGTDQGGGTVPRPHGGEELGRLFPGESELARRMRAFDWSASDLGPPGRWPENLRTTVSLCLTSRFPILIWWGPDLDFPTDGGRWLRALSSGSRSPPCRRHEGRLRPSSRSRPSSLSPSSKGSFVEVAKDLDIIGESTLRSWRQAIATGGAPGVPGPGNPPALEEELRRLRADVKRLTMGASTC